MPGAPHIPAVGMCGRHNVPESTLRFHQVALSTPTHSKITNEWGNLRRGLSGAVPAGLRVPYERLPRTHVLGYGCAALRAGWRLCFTRRDSGLLRTLTQDSRPGLWLCRPCGLDGGCAVREGTRVCYERYPGLMSWAMFVPPCGLVSGQLWRPGRNAILLEPISQTVLY